MGCCPLRSLVDGLTALEPGPRAAPNEMGLAAADFSCETCSSGKRENRRHSTEVSIWLGQRPFSSKSVPVSKSTATCHRKSDSTQSA